MDYSHAEETQDVTAPQWAEWSHGPRSDGLMYERPTPFNTMHVHGPHTHMSAGSRYGLDSYSNEAMNWSQGEGI